MKTAEEKYSNDPAYHTLVEMIYGLIREYQFTPSELREAAMFAATMYEMHHTRPLQVGSVKIPKEANDG